MKKLFPYIIGVVLLMLLAVIVASNTTKPLRRMDERITLRQQDKIPYGTSAARELLSSLFPYAVPQYDAMAPGDWDSINMDSPNQAVILIADYLDADNEELKSLSDFVSKGNYVFIIARSASDDLSNYFGINLRSDYNSPSTDSLKIRLEQPAYNTVSYYTYPGKKYEGSFFAIDTSHSFILGTNWAGFPNFIQLNKGQGSVFIHASPLAFSNYFVLHKSNVQYYQKAFSVLPKNVSTILWNEYYLRKPYNPDKENPNWLGALLSYASFKWALLVAAFTLVLFVLLGMRRRQRLIPVHQKPTNDSLDFVKTLGRLYYDRKDHKNLATKMASYFLEHVRSTYKLPTHTLNDDFSKMLHFKSGYAEEEIRKIIASIEAVKVQSTLSDSQLFHFHNQLNLFYQNT
ncbi:MAG TPA: DUF4350 domain-containing protein [Flavisolibacter sp.]|jgi:hypothetical protein|nr:DUF4350 domain-containing protein [Flavisolibacter sp.]